MSANSSIQSPKIQTNIYAVDSSSVMGKDIAWSTGGGGAILELLRIGRGSTEFLESHP